MVGKYKILSSTYLFDDLWFKVRKDRCEAPNGMIIDPYYVYEFPEWVSAVALTKDGQVIMEKQYRHGIGEIAYELPGGVVDESDPDFETAIRREMREETGYEFENLMFLGKTCANPSTNSNWMHMFLATGGQLLHQPSLDDGEFMEVELMSIDQVIDLFQSNQIIQSMHQTCLFLALKQLGHIQIK